MIVVILFQLFIFAFAITVHEFAHGWVAYKLGDPTAKYLGRLSLNPLSHIDLVGTIILPLSMVFMGLPAIGWAKPVPINFLSLHNPKKDMLWVGAAGPLANFLAALFLASVLKIPAVISFPKIVYLLNMGVLINLMLGVFNLIPIPPLDGSRIVTSLLPYRYIPAYASIEPFGFLIIFALLWAGAVRTFVFPVVINLASFLGVDFSVLFR